jgi:hypothetical protein
VNPFDADPLDADAMMALLRPQTPQQGGGAVIRKPQIESDSVLDSTVEKYGKKLLRFLGGDDAASQVMGIAGALEVPGGAQGPVAKALDTLLKKIPNPIKAYHGSPHEFQQFDPSKIGTGEGAQGYAHGLYFAESPEVAKTYQTAGGGNKPGHLYEVNLHADPADLLDWDAPLSQQSEKVKGALERLNPVLGSGGKYADYMNLGVGDIPEGGGRLYRQLEMGEGAPPVGLSPTSDQAVHTAAKEKASQLLSKSGIPGIKYLDQGSRGAKEGTRNYVMFDDSKIEMVKKLGLALAVSSGMLSQAEAAQMKAQGYQ